MTLLVEEIITKTKKNRYRFSESFTKHSKFLTSFLGDQFFILRNDKYDQKRIKELISICNKSHSTIRKMIDGISFSKTIDIKEGQVPIDPGNTINCLSLAIGANDVARFVEYAKSIDLSVPSGPNEPKKTKLLSKYIEENNINYRYHINSKNDFNYYLSGLGNLWTENRIKDAKYNILFTTSIKPFLLIGHNGVDNSSCFKNGASNYKCKFEIAKRKNTFVILGYQKEITDDKPKIDDVDVKFRAWGAYDNKNKTISFTNKYGGSVSKVEYIVICKDIAKTILKEDDLEYKQNILHTKKSDGYIYLNRDSITFYKKGKKVLKQIV